MPRRTPARAVAGAEALLAAGIWASSFVGVKAALAHTGPLTVAGLRYTLAFLLLLPLLGRGRGALPAGAWPRLALIGIAQYTVGNGALFWSLRTLSAAAGSLSLSLVPIVVLLLQIVWLRERPSGVALLGLALTVGGSVLFFLPTVEAGDAAALGALAVAILAFAVLPVVGRELARAGSVGTVPLTAIPLGIGGGILLGGALAWEGVPELPLAMWGVIVGLAVVNTALAYLVYNHALRHLTAVEANVILNLSPLGTALLAWVTLGETLSPLRLVAMAIVLLGAGMVQGRRGGGGR
ncbi:EamA family transporter [Candidatus Bipolaricaulota bacterium]|nr:EamA family transporter [Candidatus Bipolaricaulota bacterium]